MRKCDTSAAMAPSAERKTVRASLWWLSCWDAIMLLVISSKSCMILLSDLISYSLQRQRHNTTDTDIWITFNRHSLAWLLFFSTTASQLPSHLSSVSVCCCHASLGWSFSSFLFSFIYWCKHGAGHQLFTSAASWLQHFLITTFV